MEEKNFCDNVRRIRLENKLTKKEMAQICKIGVRSLSLLETGTIPRRLGADVVLRISNYFNINPTSLFENHINSSDL